MLAEAYRDKTILLTGGTGFLGTALVEKILRSLPDLGRLYLIVRPSKDKGADERFRKDMLGSAAFRRLRDELGDAFDERVAEKVRILEGDVHAPSLGLGEDDLAELSENVDVVVHSAASVVFDAPLDAAVDSNVRGTVGLLKLARGWSKRPLFMHISTAYVAGNIKGAAPEEPPGASTPNGTILDAREEILGLEAVVAEVDQASQERDLLRRFETEARNELGMVGEEEEVAARVDQLRRAWMRERLVERGTERARELGWNDVYTFTKSLAERTVVAERGRSPLVILRPGHHREQFQGALPGVDPGLPHGRPHHHGLREGPPARVPRRPRDPRGHCPRRPRRERDPRRRHQAPRDARGLPRGLGPAQPFALPGPLRPRPRLLRREPPARLRRPAGPSAGVELPRAQKVELALRAQLAALKVGGQVAARLPDGHMVSDARQRMARAEKRARMSLYYSRIYGAYANMYAVFSTDRTKRLYEGLEPEDRETFPFDITEVRWREWLHGTHLPALTTRPNRKKRRKVEEKPGEVAAIFDVDGTLVGSNVVSYYAWLRMQELPAPLRPLWLAAFLTKIPYYWGLDKVSRAHFNRVFYKNYAGWKPERAKHLGRESFAGFTLDRIFPDALDRLREHKALGHRVVLLSGALDFLLEPMKDLADDVLCSTLAQENGTYTGELSGSPVAGDARARMLASYARKRNVDLSRSYAYADAISDLPMLEAVGHPVAVNPDRRLRSAAEGRGWDVRDWGKDRVAKKI